MKIRLFSQIVVLLSISGLCLAIESPGILAQDISNQSRLVVAFRMSKGRLIVDRQISKAKFTPSENFCKILGISGSQCIPGSQFAPIEAELFKDLDKILAQFQKFYFYALTDQEQQLDLNGKLDDELTRLLKNFSGSWLDLKKACTSPNAQSPDKCPLGPMLNALMNNPTTGGQNFSEAVSSDTALIPTPGPLASETDPFYDADSGSANFFVIDPVKSWRSKTDYLICFSSKIAPNQTEPPCQQETNPQAERIRKRLAQLKTTLWRPRAMRTIIESYYTTKGFQPTVTFNVQGAKWINIQQSSRLARILLPGKGVESESTNKILYLLLAETQFRNFLSQPVIECIELTIPSASNDQPAEVRKFQKIDYLNLGSKQDQEPLLNLFQLQYQQAGLAQLGFTITVQANGEESRRGKSYYDLNILKAAEPDQPPKENNEDEPKPATAEVNESGLIETKTLGHTDFEPHIPKAGAGVGGSACGEESTSAAVPAGPKERKNYLAWGVEYKPGQGVRGIFVGQRSKLGPGNLSGQIGGHQEILGQVNYSADFVGFKSLGHRRVSLQLNGSSDFVARRILTGVSTDERRVGGMARAELELFRDLSGNLLRLSLEARHALVTLSQADKPNEKKHLSTVDFGAYYLVESGPAPTARRLTLEPRLRLGLRLANKSENFTAFFLQGHYHNKLSDFLETDLNGRAAIMSKKTPIFEQASFGGAEVVRGFREDDAIGRRLWSIQPELWTPIPGIRKYEDGPGAFFSRNVRLAGFVDFGGVYATTASKSGVRAGPGLGARIIYGGAVIKLDWAYGLGETIQGRGRGRFYFSLGFNRPF